MVLIKEINRKGQGISIDYRRNEIRLKQTQKLEIKKYIYNIKLISNRKKIIKE